MKIVFDMDNTLADEFGKEMRPNVDRLLAALRRDGHELVLWTSSTKPRAEEILSRLNLRQFFSQFLFREDYDPNNEGLVKDIGRVEAVAIVDDDPKQVDAANDAGLQGVLISAYRGGAETKEELVRIYAALSQSGGGISGLWKRLTGRR